MHSVLEGVMKRFFKIWFSDTLSAEEGSLKGYIEQINERVLKVRPPSFVPTALRDISLWKMWRAKEFLIFFIYYSLPVFHGYMSQERYLNLIKFVISIEYLLKRKLDRNNLEIVRKIILDFVEELEEIYSRRIMLSGFHELLHLVDCTLDFGPLNNINAFQFEEINRKIVSFIHGHDLVGDEFLKVFSMCQSLNILGKKVQHKSMFENFIDKHMSIKSSNLKRVNSENLKISEYYEFEFDFVLNQCLTELSLNIDKIQFAKRLTLNGAVFTDVSVLGRFNDSCVQTKDGRFGHIIRIIVINEIIYLFIKRIVFLISSFYHQINPQIRSHLFFCPDIEDFSLVKLEESKKVLYINLGNNLCFLSTFNMSHLFH